MQWLTQYQLSHMLTPLGEYTKDRIRAIARELACDRSQARQPGNLLRAGRRL